MLISQAAEIEPFRSDTTCKLRWGPWEILEYTGSEPAGFR